MTLSLLGTAFLSGPLMAQVPQVPRMTPELLASFTDRPEAVRVSVRLFLGPGAEQATYAFTQMNGPTAFTLETLSVETATEPDAEDAQLVTNGTRSQELLLQRLLAIPGPAWHPLEYRRFGVRPQSRAEVTVFSPEGELLAAGELTTHDSHPAVLSVLDSLRSRRCQLLRRAAPAQTLQTQVAPSYDPADS